MKPLKYTFVCLLFALTSFAQQRSAKNKVNFSAKCGIETDCYSCTDTIAKYKDKLKGYFSKQINWRVMEQIAGVIVVDIAVSENGAVCCRAIYNYTANDNNAILALNLPDLINHMPAWKPAIKNGAAINSIRTIAIYSFVKGRLMFDVDYIKSDKKIRWEPSKDLQEVRKTIGTSEVDNTFDPNRMKNDD